MRHDVLASAPADHAVARTPRSWFVLQVALVASAIVTYFSVRGLTEGSVGVALRHARDLDHLERLVGLDVEAAVQAPLVASSALATAANWVYIWGHWPVILTCLAWLLWRHRPVYAVLRDGMLLSGFLGMFVFASFPVASPRLAGLGIADTVTERSEAYRYLQPPAFVNQYAAMPSLHAGWDLLVGLALLAASGSIVVRVVGVALPVLMTWAVVATGNHFVVDVVAGILLALAGHWFGLWRQRRRCAAGASP